LYPSEEQENVHVPPGSTPVCVVLLRQPMLPEGPDRSRATEHAVRAGLELNELFIRLGLRGSERQIGWVTSDHEAARNMPGWVLAALGLFGELPPWDLPVRHLPALNEQDEGGESSSGRREPLDAFRRRVVACAREAVEDLQPVRSAGAGSVKVLLVFAGQAVIEAVADAAVRGDGVVPGMRWVVEQAFSSQWLTVLHARAGQVPRA
jgi:hypothetical protein